MREIKFRAWDKEEKEMVSWKTLIDYCDLDYLFGNINETPKRVTIPDFDVMQYTGLKDKNGIEIFEGDVLTSNVQPCKMVNPIKDGYGVVRFENGMFKLGAISLVTFISKMEVIGNIYENPELLEREAK